MPIRIPPDALIVRDRRLTFLKALSTLSADGGFADVTKKAVKASMLAKGAKFAESDFVLARLQGGGGRTWIDPRKLHNLLANKTITLAEFLSAISVKVTALKPFLSDNEIDAISRTVGTEPVEPSLFPEWKTGVEIDPEKLQAAILDCLDQK